MIEDDEVVDDEALVKERHVLDLMIKTRKEQKFNKKEAARLLVERGTVRFQCENCKFEWMKAMPAGYTIRSGDGTNYFVSTMDDDGMRTYIPCPKCKKSKNIRRLPVMKMSFHSQAQRRAVHEMDDPFMEPQQ